MYNESYEEYIRNILGYPNYNNSMNKDIYQNNSITVKNNEIKMQLEACYPEIYKIIYPMINKACINNTKPVTADLIEELTAEIYQAIESDTQINSNLADNTKSVGNRNTKTEKESEREVRNVSDRQFKNRELKDLIRILLIRELIRDFEKMSVNHLTFSYQDSVMGPTFQARSTGVVKPPIIPRSSYPNNIYESF